MHVTDHHTGTNVGQVQMKITKVALEGLVIRGDGICKSGYCHCGCARAGGGGGGGGGGEGLSAAAEVSHLSELIELRM